MSIAAALVSYKAAAAGKDEPKFTAAPATHYAHQTNAKTTVGAQPFHTEERAKTVFGKNNPNKYGVLPVLVVIQNDGGKAIRAGDLRLELIGPNRSRVAATPPAEVRYLSGPRRPGVTQSPTGAPKVVKKKNPLDTWEIEGRAFSAKMILPGESASGFFYFETPYYPGSRLYLTGLTEADTGNELFYFEVPFE
jgi:hypothetical protein